MLAVAELNEIVAPVITFNAKTVSVGSLIKLMNGILSGVTKRLLLGTINIFLPM
jgi:hypothetical protein